MPARSKIQTNDVRTGRTMLTGMLAIFFTASLSLMGCSGSSSDPNATGSPLGTGSVTVTSRTIQNSATPSDSLASPDNLAVTLEGVDISIDGTNYQTAVSGPVKVSLDSSSNPLLGSLNALPAGSYGALRVTISDISWNAGWLTTNPSSCTGLISGGAQGSQPLGTQHPLYFMTPNLGGNTEAYYRSNPPLSGYVGDANHPLLMPAPIQVFANQTTALNLVFDTDHILGCSRVGLFTSTDAGDTAPQRSILGEASALAGADGLFADTRHGLIGVTNGGGNSITLYSTGASGDTTPARTIAGPATRMNAPQGVLFYRGAKTDGSDDEIIVANKGNNSVTAYSSLATGNTAPLRTITGFSETLLNEPSGIALYPDPNGDPAKDEVWVANYGSDAVTVYNRINDGDALPIYPATQSTSAPLPSIGGSATGLSEPCGIDVDPANNLVYVANAGNDSVTVYDRTAVTQSVDGNVAPTSIISGSSTGLSRPCGIRVDTADNELFVANAGAYPGFQQSSITVYDLTTLANSNNNVAPKRVLAAGSNSGLTNPTALMLQGTALWVADRGPQPAMTQLPDIYPSASTVGGTARASLSGDYNVILYGVDLSHGVNGHGYHIPVIFAERGIANFNPQSSPWPGFQLRIDTENRRTVIDRGCAQADVGGLPKNGFYDITADGTFYAFTQGDHGSLRGAYLPNGQAFTASFYDGPDKMFVLNGVKTTALTTPYLGSDGSQTGSTAHYAYAAYANQILQLRRYDPTPGEDIFRYQLTVGDADADHSAFNGVTVDANLNTLGNPMGDFGAQQTAGVLYRQDFISLTQEAYSSHAGGQFENQSFYYGMAGALSNTGSTMLFMNNTNILDSDNCPTRLGEGMGLRQTPTKTFKNADLKGVYFVTGFGDQFQSTSLPDIYIAESGTLTFDGNGAVQMTFNKNTQGQGIALDNNSLTYTVTARTLPSPGSGIAASGTVNVVDLFGTDKTIPFASALIGEDGRTLIFYRNLVQPNSGTPPAANPIRLLGMALYQHP